MTVRRNVSPTISLSDREARIVLDALELAVWTLKKPEDVDPLQARLVAFVNDNARKALNG